jgi:hypothetical protein
VLDHDPAQVGFHPGVGDTLAAVVFVAALDVVDDAVPAEQFALVLFAGVGAGREEDGKAFAARAVQDQVHGLRREFVVRGVQVEVVVPGQRIHQAAGPQVFVVLEGFGDEAAAPD